MKYINRLGEIVDKPDAMNRFLKKIYANRTGRFLMKQLCNRPVSELTGRFLDSGFSRILIQPFSKNNGIDSSLYENRKFRSFNDFFTRKSSPHVRRFSENPRDFCAPCDGKLTVVPLSESSTFEVKGSTYTVESLLRYRKLADRLAGGQALIFRLSPDNFHRYSYFDAAKKSRNYHISGRYYSVDPAVVERVPVYKENEREFTILETENFGTCIYMEVGAMMVGKIVNHYGDTVVRRGEEKGYFAFGGSTIIVLLQKNAVQLLEEYTDAEYEVEVRMGDVLGAAPAE